VDDPGILGAEGVEEHAAGERHAGESGGFHETLAPATEPDSSSLGSTQRRVKG
jgi:hypothetical protein